MKARSKGCARVVAAAALGLLALCLAAAAVSVIFNRLLPARSQSPERLSALDKTRLAEAFHLRQALGDQVLPGWSRADIPVILYNEETLFLVGLEDPQPGWSAVPGGANKGRDWELEPGGEFLGLPAYRQPLPASGENTQAFTVRVGDRWTASMATLDWMRVSMGAQIRQEFPSSIQSAAPYAIMVKLLIPNSDVYVTAILHESVHAYQGMRAGERLAAAELLARRLEPAYPWEDERFKSAWQVELDTLNRAMRAAGTEEAKRLAGEFLNLRNARRDAAKLSADLVDYERAREWEEGIAKYAELMSYRLASDSGYQPLPEMSGDPDFRQYKGAMQKWDQEVAQIRREAGATGDGRFYYTGFAQAALLDRLSPGWKERLFEPGVYLEDLLAQALP